MATVWKDETITNPTEKLLLLALADHANDEGMCWPSVKRLAKWACISTGQVRRLISKLERDGWLTADRRGGAGRASTYWLTVENARTDARVFDGETRAPEPETRAPMHKTRASVRAQPPITPNDPEGMEEKTFPNGGGGETKPAAPDRDAAALDLPAEIVAAWRWPLTDKARKALANAVRTYSAGEVLTAIEIMRSSPKEIERPAAYLKTVLQRRVSTMVDKYSAPPSSDDGDKWAAIAQETATHREPISRPAVSPWRKKPEEAGDDHAAEVQAAFSAILPTLHPATSAALAGAICTNGDGYTIHLPPERAAMLGFLTNRKTEIRDAMHRERGTVEVIRFALQGSA